MGVCGRNNSHRSVCLAPANVSFRRLFRRGPVGTSSRDRRHCAYLHAHLSKRGNDDRNASNHRRAIAINQLQRLVRADDHVRLGPGKQCLGSSGRSRVRRSIRGRPPGMRGAGGPDRGETIYFRSCLPVESGHTEMEADYKVKLEVFEGPLDLLLYLIKQDEIDIYDISLERITSQYLEYLQAFKELNIELAGEFIVMAANLI